MLSAVLCLSFALFADVSAKVGEKIRTDFPQIVQELCQSSLTYSLDKNLEEESKKYHDRMNCLFNHAMSDAVNDMNREFSKKWNKIPQSASFENISFSGEGCSSLKQVQRIQITKGYQTLCDTEGENPTVDTKNYSACKVTETAMNEFCAYQEYLEWKYFDDYRSEGIFDSTLLFGFNERFEEEKFRHESELAKAKRALEEMLYRYEKFEQQNRIHMWLVTVRAALEKTRDLLTEIRKAVYKFPDKFNYAASKNCDQ